MRTLATTGVLALGALSTARADEPAPAPVTSPSAAAGDQLALPGGAFLIDGFVEISLSKDAVFKPISLTPDLWYGATDELTLGLVHSSIATTGFIGGAGDSLCLTGSSNGCAHLYKDVGVDVRYRIASPWSIDAGLFAANVSNPFLAVLKAGASGRWRFDKLVLELQPNLLVALNNRTSGSAATAMVAAVTPNNERLDLPVTIGYEVAPKVELEGQTGVSLPFSQVGEFYQVPLAVGVRYRVDDHLALGFAFALPALLGGNSLLHGIDARTATLGVSYAL